MEISVGVEDGRVAAEFYVCHRGHAGIWTEIQPHKTKYFMAETHLSKKDTGTGPPLLKKTMQSVGKTVWACNAEGKESYLNKIPHTGDIKSLDRGG